MTVTYTIVVSKTLANSLKLSFSICEFFLLSATCPSAYQSVCLPLAAALAVNVGAVIGICRLFVWSNPKRSVLYGDRLGFKDMASNQACYIGTVCHIRQICPRAVGLISEKSFAFIIISHMLLHIPHCRRVCLRAGIKVTLIDLCEWITARWAS